MGGRVARRAAAMARMHWTSPQMRSGLRQWRTKHAVVIRTIRQR